MVEDSGDAEVPAWCWDEPADSADLSDELHDGVLAGHAIILRSLLRHNVSTVGWNAGSSRGKPAGVATPLAARPEVHSTGFDRRHDP